MCTSVFWYYGAVTHELSNTTCKIFVVCYMKNKQLCIMYVVRLIENLIFRKRAKFINFEELKCVRHLSQSNIISPNQMGNKTVVTGKRDINMCSYPHIYIPREIGRLKKCKHVNKDEHCGNRITVRIIPHICKYNN